MSLLVTEVCAGAIAGGTCILYAAVGESFSESAGVVNLVLPVLALLVTAWYPRRLTAALGGPLTYGGFALGKTLRQTPRFWQWTWGTAASFSHPVLVVGAVVVALLGVGLAQALRSWRRVGVPHDPGACPACGYQRGVLAVCPECGASGPGSPL